MIREGERSGALRRDRILLDATSGNTGISYAMIGALARLSRDAVRAVERHRRTQTLLQIYGAELIFTDPMDGSDGAIREARRLYEREPHRYFYPDQVQQPRQLARALRNDRRRDHRADGRPPDPLRRGPGHRGHVRRNGPTAARVAAVGAVDFGAAGVGTARTRRAQAHGVVDRAADLRSDRGRSRRTGVDGRRACARAPAGASTTACWSDRRPARRWPSACAWPERLERAVIVMIFPDRGDRYLSEPFWNGGDEVESQTSGPDRTSQSKTPRARSLLPDDVLASIRQHGAAAYPDECCGALIGDESGQVIEALSLSNTTTDERKRRFLIGPDAYRAAEKRASETGRTLIGFYHSHPNHPAVPSAFDLAHAWPNLRYLILSVRGGRPEEARTWRLREDRSAFDEETVVTQPQRLRA